MGLVIYGVFLLYLAVSVGLVMAAAFAAKKRNIARWKFALPVGLVMYLLVFWDHIPTVVTHKYYCDKYAGLTVYKTVEQWKAENPGVAETLVANEGWDKHPEYINEERVYKLNERFHLVTGSSQESLGIKKRFSKVVDVRGNKIVAERVNFSTDIKNLSLGQRNFRDYKFWMGNDSCEPPGSYTQANGFKSILQKYLHIGG